MLLNFGQYKNLYQEYLNENYEYTPDKIFLNKELILNIQENISSQLKELFLLDEEDFSFIGSSGKRETSVNIDILIDKNKFEEKNNIKENFHLFIKEQLNRRNILFKEKINENKYLINWLYLNENEERNTIDVFILLSENFENVKYFRYSPLDENESLFHSKYRELFFKAIANNHPKIIKEYFKAHNVKNFLMFDFNPEEGLIRKEKTFVGKHGVLKQSKIVENSEKIIYNEKEKTLKFLFGIEEEIDLDNFKTFEKCFEFFISKDFGLPSKRLSILETYKGLLNKRNLEIPEDVNKLIKKLKRK